MSVTSMLGFFLSFRIILNENQSLDFSNWKHNQEGDLATMHIILSLISCSITTTEFLPPANISTLIISKWNLFAYNKAAICFTPLSKSLDDASLLQFIVQRYFPVSRNNAIFYSPAHLKICSPYLILPCKIMQTFNNLSNHFKNLIADSSHVFASLRMHYFTCFSFL